MLLVLFGRVGLGEGVGLPAATETEDGEGNRSRVGETGERSTSGLGIAGEVVLFPDADAAIAVDLATIFGLSLLSGSSLGFSRSLSFSWDILGDDKLGLAGLDLVVTCSSFGVTVVSFPHRSNTLVLLLCFGDDMAPNSSASMSSWLSLSFPTATLVVDAKTGEEVNVLFPANFSFSGMGCDCASPHCSLCLTRLLPLSLLKLGVGAFLSLSLSELVNSLLRKEGAVKDLTGRGEYEDEKDGEDEDEGEKDEDFCAGSGAGDLVVVVVEEGLMPEYVSREVDFVGIADADVEPRSGDFLLLV